MPTTELQLLWRPTQRNSPAMTPTLSTGAGQKDVGRLTLRSAAGFQKHRLMLRAKTRQVQGLGGFYALHRVDVTFRRSCTGQGTTSPRCLSSSPHKHLQSFLSTGPERSKTRSTCISVSTAFGTKGERGWQNKSARLTSTQRCAHNGFNLRDPAAPPEKQYQQNSFTI